MEKNERLKKLPLVWNVVVTILGIHIMNHIKKSSKFRIVSGCWTEWKSNLE